MSARSRDVADNLESPTTRIIKIDKSAPVITIATPQPNAVLPVGTALNFSARDSVSGLERLMGRLSDGRTTVNVTSGYVITQPGSYALTVEARDIAGNTVGETRTFRIIGPPG